MKPQSTPAEHKHPFRKAIRILLIAAALYCAVSMLASGIVFRVLFPRKSGTSPLSYSYEELQPDFTRTTFVFRSGRNQLCGVRYDADSPKGLIVVINGIGAGADAHLAEITEFVRAGWSVATWDTTGIGNSEGRGIVGLQQIRNDLFAFLRYLETGNAQNGLPLVLYGHSAGAYAAASALSEHPEIKAAVCIAGFDRPVSLIYAHAKNRVGFLATMQYPFLAFYNFSLFGPDANASARDAIDAVSTPVLIIGGDSDDLVPYAESLVRDPGDYTNPNVRCLLITSPYRNEHSTPWLSPGAARYRAELQDPSEADKALANELDPEFTELILRFCEDAIR